MAIGQVDLTFTMVGRDQLAATLRKGEQGFKRMGGSAKKAAESSVPWGRFVGELRGLPLTLTGVNQGFELIKGALSGAHAALTGFVQTMAEAERAAHMETTFDRLIPRAKAFRQELRDIAGGMMETAEIDRYAIKMDLAGASAQDTAAMFKAAAELNAVAGEELGQLVEQMMGSVIEGDATMEEWLGTQLDLNHALEVYAHQIKKSVDELRPHEQIHARMLAVTALLTERQKTLGNTVDNNAGSWQKLARRMEELPKHLAKSLLNLGKAADTIKDGDKDVEMTSIAYDRATKAIRLASGELANDDSLHFARDAILAVGGAYRDAGGEIPRVMEEMNAALGKEHARHAAMIVEMQKRASQSLRQQSGDRLKLSTLEREHSGRILDILETHTKKALVHEHKAASDKVKARNDSAEANRQMAIQAQKLIEHELKQLDKEIAEIKKRNSKEKAAKEQRRAVLRAVADAEFSDQQQHNLHMAGLLGKRELIEAQHKSRVATMRRHTIMGRAQQAKFEERSEAQRNAALKSLGDQEWTDQKAKIQQQLAIERLRQQALVMRQKTSSGVLEIEMDFLQKRRQIQADVLLGEKSKALGDAELNVLELERERAHGERVLELRREQQERQQQLKSESLQVALSMNQELQNLSTMHESDEIAVMSTLAAASAQVAKDFKNLKAGAPGSIQALGAVSAAAIRDTKAQAGVQGAFAAAESAFMFARGNFVGGAAAAAAAGMYFAIAGGAMGGGGGAKKAKPRTTAVGTGGGGAIGQLGGGGGNVTVNVQGFVGSTVDLGVGVARAQAQLGESQYQAGDTI